MVGWMSTAGRLVLVGQDHGLGVFLGNDLDRDLPGVEELLDVEIDTVPVGDTFDDGVDDREDRLLRLPSEVDQSEHGCVSEGRAAGRPG